MLDSLIIFFTSYGYLSVFGVLLLCGFGVPIPEDIVLVSGGFIASLSCPLDTTFSHAVRYCNEVHYMFAVSMAGVLIGDSCMYMLGRFGGGKLLETSYFKKLIPRKRLKWIQKKFERYGVLMLFFARFMPGLRSPIFVVAGMSQKVSYIKFVLTDGFAALISVPIWVYLGFWGERQVSDIDILENYIKRSQLTVLAIVGIILVSLIAIYFIKRKIKQKTHILDDE